MIVKVFIIAWWALAFSLAMFDIRQPAFDTKRCVAGWKVDSNGEYYRECWPKRGCWMDAAGVAQCWQVEHVKAAKPSRRSTR